MHVPAPCAEEERAIQNRAHRGSSAALGRSSPRLAEHVATAHRRLWSSRSPIPLRNDENHVCARFGAAPARARRPFRQRDSGRSTKYDRNANEPASTEYMKARAYAQSTPFAPSSVSVRGDLKASLMPLSYDHWARQSFTPRGHGSDEAAPRAASGPGPRHGVPGARKESAPGGLTQRKSTCLITPCPSSTRSAIPWLRLRLRLVQFATRLRRLTMEATRSLRAAGGLRCRPRGPRNIGRDWLQRNRRSSCGGGADRARALAHLGALTSWC